MKKAEGFYVYRWMIDDLHLRGVQLLSYAIIYAFSRNGKCFENGHGYLRAMVGCSAVALTEALTVLSKRKLISIGKRFAAPSVYRNIYKREKRQTDSATSSPFCCTINNIDSLKEACK